MATATAIAGYADERELCKTFLQDFKTLTDETPKYLNKLQDIANRTSKVLEVHLDDVNDFPNSEVFSENISSNTLRYISLFASAAEDLLPAPTVQTHSSDIFDVITSHRTQQPTNDDGVPKDSHQKIPDAIRRRFEVRIVASSKTKTSPLRRVGAAEIGHLVKLRGICTRVTDVQPMISVATYSCDVCGYEVYQEVTAKSFMPLTACPTTRCQTNQNTGKLHMQTRASKFVKFQEMRLQEVSEEVPIGNVPRQLTVHVKGELTRSCGPGDVVTVSGIFLPTPYVGFKGRNAGLIADTYVEAMTIEQHKKNYANYDISQEDLKKVEELAKDGDCFNKLSASIAPEIFGHDFVKKALLLLLVGGVTKEMGDGLKIRGDINICLMGDPGVAKSQLLKHITSIAPRSVYTTGKGSSGVGLTAAVLRDPLTNELVLEGGALVLADMGICAIDEFDKMDDSDRTAIHEVMEQQTVSIAKAGVTTTLNARTAILAAANPAFGRYNTRRKPEDNIDLPPALLSRFDLLFLILDKPDPDADASLARHVTYVHKHLQHPPIQHEVFDAHFLRQYISCAREFEPVVPSELSNYIVESYVRLRKRGIAGESGDDDGQNVGYTYTTARGLLSILRLAQSMARLRFSDTVSQADVEEAINLMDMSKASLRDDEMEKKRRSDPITAIYDLVRELSEKKESREVKMSDLRPALVARGFTDDHLNETIDEYVGLNLWHVDARRSKIRFVL